MRVRMKADMKMDADSKAKMKLAFSPCPNDTFVFHAWVHGLVDGAPIPEVLYADIDVTNGLISRQAAEQAAVEAGPDLLKISCAALPWALPEYDLLPCGGALGSGCGPLLLSADASIEARGASALTGRTVAVPSLKSTAYLLFRLWADKYVPEGIGEIIVMPFHRIMPAVRDGLVAAGLVIHEARFTYMTYGLSLLADMGSWWEEETGLPIPLGVIVSRRSTTDPRAVAGWLRQSVEYAWTHPQASAAYVLEHAQEMSQQVVDAHIGLYVNEYTRNLGVLGYRAIELLLTRAARIGLTPEVDRSLLYAVAEG